MCFYDLEFLSRIARDTQKHMKITIDRKFKKNAYLQLVVVVVVVIKLTVRHVVRRFIFIRRNRHATAVRLFRAATP